MNVICFDQVNRPDDCIGQYVGIRVYDPTCTTGKGMGEITANQNHVYPRIHAFQVYGEYTDAVAEPVNSIGTLRSATKADLKNIAETKTNLLKTATLYIFNREGKKVNSSENDKYRIINIIRNNDGTQSHTDIRSTDKKTRPLIRTDSAWRSGSRNGTMHRLKAFCISRTFVQQ